MPYYKYADGRLFFLDSEEEQAFLPKGWKKISDDEGKALEASPALTEREAIINQIADLEMQATPRRLREAALGEDDGWLKDLDAKISALRAKLPPD